MARLSSGEARSGLAERTDAKRSSSAALTSSFSRTGLFASRAFRLIGSNISSTQSCMGQVCLEVSPTRIWSGDIAARWARRRLSQACCTLELRSGTPIAHSCVRGRNEQARRLRSWNLRPYGSGAARRGGNISRCERRFKGGAPGPNSFREACPGSLRPRRWLAGADG